MATDATGKAEGARWIPLESNPEVFNSWSKKMGLVTDQFEFADVYGLEDELLGMVPHPVKAVLVLFQITKEYEERRKKEDADVQEGKTAPFEENVVWIKQTIGNACGTMGLLHALINSDVTFEPESNIEKFIEQCIGLTPGERAELLDTSPLFTAAHEEGAKSGQSSIPNNLDTDYHFTTFVQAPRIHPDGKGVELRLIELDGRRNGPADRGPSSNLLKDVAEYVKKTLIDQSNGVDLAMTALAAGPKYNK